VIVVPWGQEEAGPLVKEGFSHPLLQGGVGVIHQRLMGEGGGPRDKVEVDNRHF